MLYAESKYPKVFIIFISINKMFDNIPIQFTFLLYRYLALQYVIPFIFPH